MLSVIESATWSTSRSLPPSTDTCKDDIYARNPEDHAIQVGFAHCPQCSLPKDPVTIMATKLADYKTYHVTGKEISEETPETMDALDDLMFKVGQIPGIDILVDDRHHPIVGGVSVIIRKESSNA